ncbi:hypothetical protein [Olsenella sp. Marseille-P4559]|uniref:hypothetical protein n=1 Tax=Olsenella sp. Marseille-P4559 TaxID=2364795 RepID=UPI001030E211|nr:hypothetical protein [Olsenella sp. Marseille-P4559]
MDVSAVEEHPLTPECTVELSDDEHGMPTDKVVAERADESILTYGHVGLDKLRHTIFDSSANGYRVVGEEVGKAWHDGVGLLKQ